jgi:hypothetical protein
MSSSVKRYEKLLLATDEYIFGHTFYIMGGTLRCLKTVATFNTNMTSFIKSVKYVHDVESDLSYVEIVYDQYKRGEGYETFTDYMNTEPLADWVTLESKKQSIPYEKFLDTMVKKTVEVRQRLIELALDTILSYERSEKTYMRIAHAVKIIDPTFQPPRVNMGSAWQMEFIKNLCKEYLPDAVQECTNKSRLEYMFNVLRIIDLE